MAGLTPQDHTRAVLGRMSLSSPTPGSIDRGKDASGDNYGLTAARSSDSSSFGASGAPKSPNLGRPGRATGGRLSLSGTLQRNRRTPEETKSDIDNEDRVANELANDRGRAHGGRIGRSTGGSATAKDEYTQAGRTMMNEDASGKDQWTGGNFPPSRATGGRTNYAKGGRTKGKTTVNVIIGGDKQMPPPIAPPPMAAPGPVGPPPGPPPGLPPGPPPGGMPRPPGMPIGGAPMGPAGAPPPGVPPMLRARGGRIEIETPGVHDYGKAGVKHGSTEEKYGGGSGLGRMQNARHAK
jgi:hypothetical protein